MAAITHDCVLLLNCCTPTPLDIPLISPEYCLSHCIPVTETGQALRAAVPDAPEITHSTGRERPEDWDPMVFDGSVRVVSLSEQRRSLHINRTER